MRRRPSAVLALILFLLLPGVASAIWRLNDSGGGSVTPRKIKPKVTRPSGPANVTLFVVSRSELGVKWDPPLFDGGKAITKYLVEWDTDKSMTSGIVSPSNHYNSDDGPLVRSEVVPVSEETKFRITGLDEGQKYYVRVSAYSEGYSNAVSSQPPQAIPTGMLPGFLTDVSLTVTDTADRLHLAWSASEFDVNGFDVLPIGCDGGPTPPTAPDEITAYRVIWDKNPSFSNAKTYDLPAVVGDGSPKICCPSDVNDEGTCAIDIGAEVQSISIMYPQSTTPSGENLFDAGAVRIAYVGSQSKSIVVVPPQHGSKVVKISPSDALPLGSPIAVDDLIRIQSNVYLASEIDNWPVSIGISSGYIAPTSNTQSKPVTVQAYFTTVPSTCFDLSDTSNSAESLRSHINQNFDDSPFDESIIVNRVTLTEPYEGSDSDETRVIGYDYQVTFIGRGFSSTFGNPVEELLIISEPSSPFASVGDCNVPFVSNGEDISSEVLVQVSTAMDSRSVMPGQKYYVKIAGVNAKGVGPYMPAIARTETARSQPGIAQNCRVYSIPTSSSSLKVEWDGVYPSHGQLPSSYRVDFYEVINAESSDMVVSQVVAVIDESKRYSVTEQNLIPGATYKIIIVPVNDQGEGGPSWYSDFDPSGLIRDDNFFSLQDYRERSCHAVPTCGSASVRCDELDAGDFKIVARSVPPRPEFVVGTYPNVSNDNRFSKDSILVTFASPLIGTNGKSSGVPTDEFLIEWSTSSAFLPSTDDDAVDTLWSSVVSAQYSDEGEQNAFGELVLESLTMGTQYYVRVSAHNSAGYGAKTSSKPVRPMTKPDPPFEPILSSLSPSQLEIFHPVSNLSDSAVIGTSLLVSWQPPRVDDSNDRPDLVGDGGDAVSSYLVEWSRKAWSEYLPTEFEIKIQTATGVEGLEALSLLSGTFQIQVDTSTSSMSAMSGSFSSAFIPINTSLDMLKTILENIPNVGEVVVISPEPLTWQITFLSEIGNVEMSLVENRVFDNDMVNGDVSISKISDGEMPANSAYGFEIIEYANELVVDGAMHHIIKHLVPGMNMFVRVSSRNQVGFGPRRETAPTFSAPALQRPDGPTSLYNEEMPPFLSIHSPSSLKVHIGPSFYDGGSPLTSFLIEWDSSSTFDSSQLGDGSPLGFAEVDASSLVCSSCVTDFDISTNSFTYSGDDLTASLLIPQRKIMVNFVDDSKSYLFTILSATSSTINVENRHLRVLSASNMLDKDGGAGANLELMGATFVIELGNVGVGMPLRRSYYVRVSSINGEIGTGKSVATFPSNVMPRGFPLAPSPVSVSVKDKHTLNVSWSSDASNNDPNIAAYKIEWFSKSDAASGHSFSFFGEQEVVEFSTSGLGLIGGTFQLYFGALDTFHGIVLDTVKAKNGRDYIETSVDLTPKLNRGESILIGTEQYSIHLTNPFTPTRLPLASAYSGPDAETIPVFARPKSMPIAYDASAAELRNALERVPHVNHVDVRREINDADEDGFFWVVTFISNVGMQPSFSVDTSNLIGYNPNGFTITRTVDGVKPEDYDVTIIRDLATTSVDIKDLTTGKPYYIRLSSISNKGVSLPTNSVPIAIAPGGIPGKVSPPSIRPLNESTLLVSFEASAEANGATVEEYVIETSSQSSFTVKSQIRVQPNHQTQRITTRAHTLPWEGDSTFTLSLGDYHGDFTVAVGDGKTTVRVQNGNNVLERSTGTTSLSASVAKGEYISVGGMEFRVCLTDYHLHDDTHLSLCSKNNALAVAIFYSTPDVIDEIPIFILDTSLGAAKSPSVGDVSLSTVDALGASRDMRTRIRRGDLVRVGHPDLGETFRVSTDLERGFTDRVVPLSSIEDANVVASLSPKSLEHATYEVQSFHIRSSSYDVALTPGNELSSGYRVRFKSETTQSTNAGGDGGCLQWDGSANDLKIELETLLGIDAVEVKREVLQPVAGGIGSGVEYQITFTGSNVRGNVPPLQILDVGSNGCLDAQLLGGTFSDDIAPISVQQIETPYVPFYKIQTTTDIPYDASSADMKAALEGLSQACTVDVSRKIDRNGYSWDVTFVKIVGSTFSPLLALSANGENLSADVDPGVSVVDIQRVEVPALIGGTPIFTRVAAVNSFDMGPFTQSNPRSIELSPQPPSEPVDVFVEVTSPSSVLVQWNPPFETGGRPISHYKIEYDKLPTFTGGQNNGPTGSVLLSSSSVDIISDVQSVTVKIDSEDLLDKETYLSGTFSLAFDGQKTDQLPYNALPGEVTSALEALCNVDKVYVTRSIHCSDDPSIGCMTPEGYTWLVTFVSLKNVGDQHHKPTSKLSSRSSHRLSVDSSYLFECSDVSRATCTIGGKAVASVGTVQEVQEITVASSPFSVTIGGETSDEINIGDSLFDVEDKLNSYTRNGVGKIEVSCAECVENTIQSGDLISLRFSSFRGDLSPVDVNDPEVIVSERTKGSSQFVVGRATYSITLTGLISVHDWYVRVFAYNGIGEGIPELAWPSPIRLTTVAPQVPSNVEVTVQSASSLEVAWDRPGKIGGVTLSSFIVQYDTSPAFATRNGMPLEQMVVQEADVDASIALVTQSYPSSSDPIFRRRIIINNADVISRGVIAAGHEIVVDGRPFTVSSINAENCGVTCLALNKDVGTSVSGMKIYAANDPHHYKYSITGLKPGNAYFVRVAAVNEKAVGPYGYEFYPLNSVSSTPMDVPNALSWASMTAISNDTLRIDFGTPSSSDKPHGANGSPSSKYHIVVATGTEEEISLPEILSLSTTADSKVSGFIELSVGYQGDYNMLVSVGNQPAQFLVVPGSRRIDTNGEDLTYVLHPGEKIVVGEEMLEVRSISVGEIEVKECHIRGTGGVAVPGYRMNNYIGSAIIAPGGDTLVEANGRSLGSFLRPGEVIEVFIDEFGGTQYLTVDSFIGNSISFTPSFVGIIDKTPIYSRNKAIVRADASSASMQMSIDSLLGSNGSVEVSREGPNTREGYTWKITFSSINGMTLCSQPSWCFSPSTESVKYIGVSGLDIHDGNYVQTTFHDGRPRYDLLGKSRRIVYDSIVSEWRLYAGTSSVISSVASSETSVPFSGWSNEAVIAPPNGVTQLLLGHGATAEVTTLQTGTHPLFTNTTIVYSEELSFGTHEVQVVEVLSNEDNLSGSFELNLGTIPQKITIYVDDSEDDFTTKLQSLSGVGRVRVESAASSVKFGRTWRITFLSNSGDVPLLRHHGTSNLQGTGASLNIFEKVKGSIGDHFTVVTDLEEGRTYASRVCAENEAGVGPCTGASNTFGVYPLVLSVSSPPGPPLLQLGDVTKSQAEVEFNEPHSNGSPILSYKFEWTSSDTFGAPARVKARISCSDGSKIMGSLRFIYGGYQSRTESSVPVNLQNGVFEVTQAFNSFELLNDVEVTMVTNTTSVKEWDIAFLHDVGPVGSISLDNEGVSCSSEEQVVVATVTKSAVGTMPADYGSREIFSDEMSCGSVVLGEYSSGQHLILTASSSAVTGGSYQLMLDGESTICIPVSASASQMKNAIEGLESVGEVDVISTGPVHFPLEYKITFKGNYAYGDWPGLQVGQSFGAGDCDPFVGGVDHRAMILPIRDESNCVDGAIVTEAIVAGALTSIGGTFDLTYGDETLGGVSVGTSATEMEALLSQLGLSDAQVTRHDHDDMGEGVAWEVTYPRTSSEYDHLRVDDTFATGKNAQVNVYPILAIKIYSPENDSSGNFRIVLDGESTAPLSHQASQAKILLELHRLSGIGKVSMLGPPEGDSLSAIKLKGLIDDSFTVRGHKAIAIVGDFRSTFAPGDPLTVGSCKLLMKSIVHEDYDETQSAGLLYEALYPSSSETANAKLLGYSILQINSSANSLSFASDCSQINGVNKVVHVGSFLKTNTGVDHSIIVKAHTADLEAFEIVPESNWRGTETRIFYKQTSGTVSRTFTLSGLVKGKNYLVRASARNSRGYGLPSQSLLVAPASTTPSAPTMVMLTS